MSYIVFVVPYMVIFIAFYDLCLEMWFLDSNRGWGIRCSYQVSSQQKSIIAFKWHMGIYGKL